MSHRAMRFEGAPLECDRFVFPSCVVRSCVSEGFSQDERVTIEALGRGTEDRARARVLIVLDGHLELSVDGRTTTGREGTFMVASTIDRTLSFGGVSGARAISVDWGRSPAARGALGGFGTLSPRACLALHSVQEAVRRRTRPSAPELEVVLRTLHEVLRAEGIVVDALDRPDTTTDPEDQAAMDAFDAMLAHLEDGPTSADWEKRTFATRRTLTRRSHALHQKYGLFGLRRQTDWRAVKDFTRLLMSTIFLTHRDASVAGVARAVGYRSPAALCHAFAQAGLPAPGKFRALAAA